MGNFSERGQFNLSTAAEQFGKVEQASQKAADTLASNTNNEWQTARNKLVQMGNDIREAWDMENWFNTIPRAINEFNPDAQSGFGYLWDKLGGGDDQPAVNAPPGGTRSYSGGGGSFDSADTGGSILPQTQSLKDRYASWGFGDIGGYRPPDGFNEHSSGKAIDVMIPGWDGPGANSGTSVAQDALRQPNVEYVIWRGQTLYPDGRVVDMEDRGDPTQNHFDHVHVKTYDTGGALPPGMTLVHNGTGQDEWILNPEQLAAMKAQGIDPTTTQHGTAAGALPGPTGEQMAEMLQQASVGGETSPFDELVRTEGFIPVSAGNTGVAGTSSLAGFINMGNEVVGGLIDTGASLAKMAVSAAATAGTFGAGGQAGGAAAGIGIDMAAGMAKRGVAYGFQMGSILADALVEQAFPFGAPRWIGYDYTQFAPNLGGVQSAALTTLEKAGGAAIQQAFGQHEGTGTPPGPGGPVNPSTMPGAPQGAPPPGSDPFGTHGGTGAPPGPTPASGASNTTDVFDPLKTLGVYDSGGMLNPGQLGVNLSNRPEYILTREQWRAMEKNAVAADSRGGGATYNLYGRDDNEIVRKLK